MKAIMVMFDSLNRHLLSTYGCKETITPNFTRLEEKCTVFENFYAGSLPCMPARRELHTGRYNFLHRPWGPMEGYDDSAITMLKQKGIYTHLCTDHWHYWEEGGEHYWTKYNTYEFSRGNEGDQWKGIVGFTAPAHKDGRRDYCGTQEYINRIYFDKEENQPIAKTFQAGLDFIETNKDADNWYLQIEAFDPHEPFFSQKKYREMYPDTGYQGPEFDWPGYHPVNESEQEVAECRKNYFALLTQCDTYLGKVLDVFDKYDLWKDTLLIVNTDHGFLLSEHEWWGKINMPYWNEIAHTPFYLYSPKAKNQPKRSEALAQTIDIAPTLLDYFGLEKTKDMEGTSLLKVLEGEEQPKDYALFGQFGLYCNITDGRYVYMRSPRKQYEDILPNFMLEPHSYYNAVTVDVLKSRTEGREFSFSKGIKIPLYKDGWFVTGLRGFPPESIFDNDLLYDLETDPGQLNPIKDEEVEKLMAKAMVTLMKKNDAPVELYTRFGFVDEGYYPEEN